MKIAVLDAWPNHAETAEREFIARVLLACQRLGIDCETCVTSGDVDAFCPDFVFVTHEYSAKLTEFPTIGVIWSPLSFFAEDPYKIASMRSWDGYLVGGIKQRKFAEQLQRGLAIAKPIGDGLFLPVANESEFSADAALADPAVFYAGIHWDGVRHSELLQACDKRGFLRAYGPASRMVDYGAAYCGALPFDGQALPAAIARTGLALCLHRKEHRDDDCPSMRLFETLAVGALPICDDIGFARRYLQDIAYFLDPDCSGDAQADGIAAIIDQVRADPEAARARAKRGKDWFARSWSLEHRIRSVLLPLARRLRIAFPNTATAMTSRPPNCDIVMPLAEGCDADLRLSLQSLAATDSTGIQLALVVVGIGVANTKAMQQAAEIAPAVPVRSVPASATSLRDALVESAADFVTMLRPGDRVFPQHFRQLHHAFLRMPTAALASSETIRDLGQARDPAPNFFGPLKRDIPEHRRLVRSPLLTQGGRWAAGSPLVPGSWMSRRPALRFLPSCGADDLQQAILVATDRFGPRVFTGLPGLIRQVGCQSA